MPEEIIEAAKRNISDEKTRFEDVLAQLDQTRQELEKEKEEVDRLRLEQIDSKRNLEQYKQKTYKLMDRELQNAQDKANRIVSSAKAESQKLLDELDELRRQKESEEFSKLVQGAKSSYKSNINRLEDFANPVIGREGQREEYVPPAAAQEGRSGAGHPAGRGGRCCSLTRTAPATCRCRRESSRQRSRSAACGWWIKSAAASSAAWRRRKTAV